MRWCALVCAVALGCATPSLADDRAVLDIMTGVLEGRIDDAAQAAQALSHPYAADLVIELTDMRRGSYATEGNRSFSALRPLWRQATDAFVARHRVADGQLPSAVLRLPDSTQRLLAIDLSRHVAHLLRRDGPNGWKTAHAFYISVGVKGVGKRRRGDRRTPIGVYFTLDALDTSGLPARYGAEALTLDYPNALDRTQARTGDGIWLHGIDPANNIRPPEDTDGCVALDNEAMRVLRDEITLSETPIVMLSGIRWRNADLQPDDADQLVAQLQRWARAWSESDADHFVGFYAPGYSRLGVSAEQWRADRRRALERGGMGAVRVSEISVFLADAEAGIYLTRFVLQSAGDDSLRMLRRIYWRNGPAGWEIVAEQGH